jgi:ABC-type multidrug transport system ATPase subunit
MGSNFSQGQRQLLTIARAFLTDPAFLILDEATSSVDTRTEYPHMEAMERLMGAGRASTSAPLSTIRDAHTILVLNEGAHVERESQGALARKGLYAEQYNCSSFGGEERRGGQLTRPSDVTDLDSGSRRSRPPTRGRPAQIEPGAGIMLVSPKDKCTESCFEFWL